VTELRLLAAGEEAVWPLSFHQRGRVLRDRVRGPLPYNMHLAWNVDGYLDAGRLERRLAVIASRHPMLRARLDTSALTQIVEGSVAVPLRVEAGLSDAAAAERVTAHARDTAFDRGRAPLWECLLLQTLSGRQILALTLDHLICDGHSLAQITRELSDDGEVADTPAGGSYGDFVARQQLICDPGAGDAMTYWREHLAGTAPDRSISLPFCPRQEAPLSGTVQDQTMTLAGIDVDHLRQRRAQYRVTTFLFFLAAVMNSLGRLSRESDITVRLPVHDRSPGFASTVGWIANTVRFRIITAADADFERVIDDVRSGWVKQLPHQSIPYDVVADSLGAPQPFTQRPGVVTVISHAAAAPIAALGARLLPRPRPEGDGQGDEAGLRFSLIEGAEEFTLGCRFDPARYARDEIDLILQAVRELLTGTKQER